MWGLRLSRPKVMGFILNKPQRILMDNILVLYSINLYFLNENKEIIEIKQKFRPFTFYRTQTKPSYIIESPKLLDVEFGQKIDWE